MRPGSELPATGSLLGARVLITRSPDRAASLIAALRLAGAEPVLLPLIDFEKPEDLRLVDAALDTLSAGGYDWLVISSITAVRALKGQAAVRGVRLSALIPATVKVAAIGPSSRRVLEAEGIRVALAPVDAQSAQGLLEAWPDGSGAALLPQADIAEPLLREGLEQKGLTVSALIAYNTVAYPAAPGRRLDAVLEAAQGWAGGDAGDGTQATILDPEAARADIAAGRLDAVVAASPSAARRIAETLAPLAETRLVAIGKATAAEAATIGLTVAATATEPTPAGIMGALVAALTAPPGQRRGPSPNTGLKTKPVSTEPNEH